MATASSERTNLVFDITMESSFWMTVWLGQPAWRRETDWQAMRLTGA